MSSVYILLGYLINPLSQKKRANYSLSDMVTEGTVFLRKGSLLDSIIARKFEVQPQLHSVQDKIFIIISFRKTLQRVLAEMQAVVRSSDRLLA